ncbi:MAG TPA: sulfatase [Nitrospirota bacterium]|nr:sulfatase [Nitrospirota bacterium]
MKARKIVLISIDTLRADRLSCCGYGRETTPSLDSLAKESLVFKNAFSACSYTLPSHASMLTGKYPRGLSVFYGQGRGRLDSDRDIMVQEVLRESGYKTAAFVSSMVLKRAMGLRGGFDVYDDEMTGAEANRPGDLIRKGEETNAQALKWIRENASDDFFMFVHYFDAHGPYVNPERVASLFTPEMYGDRPIPLDMVANGKPGGIPEYQLLSARRDETGRITGCERDARVYLAQYDAGVRNADYLAGELLRELRRLDIFDEAAVIVTSDHGEAMGEGGVWFFHGLTVTPEQAHVPLIVKPPKGGQAGKTAGECVSGADIAPTILRMAGLDPSILDPDGVSLLDGPGAEGRIVLCENEWQRAVIRDGLCLLREKKNIRDGFTYYFDSKELCGGVRVLEVGGGRELDISDPRAADLLAYSRVLEKIVDPLEVSIRVSHNKIERLESELDAARKEGARLGEHVGTLLESNSWKLTAPLRALTGMIRKTTKGRK